LVPAPRTSFPGTHPPNSRVSVLPEEARRAHQLNRRPGYRSPGLLLSPRRFPPCGWACTARQESSRKPALAWACQAHTALYLVERQIGVLGHARGLREAGRIVLCFKPGGSTRRNANPSWKPPSKESRRVRFVCWAGLVSFSPSSCPYSAK
jgi:hypothetical protein